MKQRNVPSYDDEISAYESQPTQNTPTSNFLGFSDFAAAVSASQAAALSQHHHNPIPNYERDFHSHSVPHPGHWEYAQQSVSAETWFCEVLLYITCKKPSAKIQISGTLQNVINLKSLFASLPFKLPIRYFWESENKPNQVFVQKWTKQSDESFRQYFPIFLI